MVLCLVVRYGVPSLVASRPSMTVLGEDSGRRHQWAMTAKGAACHGDGDVDSNDVAMALWRAEKLWDKISKTADFVAAAKDPTFVGDPNKTMPIRMFAPGIGLD